MLEYTCKPTCRACLTDALNVIDMDRSCHFSPELRYIEVFNLCTHLNIELEDGLPQCLCSACVRDLEIVHRFLLKCLKSDGELNKLKVIQLHASEQRLVKDPLEYASNSSDEEKTVCENANNDLESFKVIAEYEDKDDNRFEDFSHMGPLPLMPSSPSESDDKDDNDFLITVESQIFPQGRFKCKLCDKTYFTNMGLRAHMEIHTPKNKTNPRESIKSTSSNRKRKKRAKNICEDNEGNNDKIPAIMNRELEKDIKRRKESQPKPKKMFPCQVCGKQMISASKLRYHMVMHTGEKDYLCTICPKAYSTIYALKHHMRAHTGERPYECKFCGDRFLRPTTLKSHMRRHTGERPYGCEICGKRFIQHSSMATHMKLNHMDKTISCPYCDKKYARQTDLNTHLLSHSGDKPFACKLCPSRFTRQSNLNKHLNQQHHQNTV